MLLSSIICPFFVRIKENRPSGCTGPSTFRAHPPAGLGPVLVYGPGACGYIYPWKKICHGLLDGMLSSPDGGLCRLEPQIGLNSLVHSLFYIQAPPYILALTIDNVCLGNDQKAGINVYGPGRGHVNGKTPVPDIIHIDIRRALARKDIGYGHCRAAGKYILLFFGLQTCQQSFFNLVFTPQSKACYPLIDKALGKPAHLLLVKMP